MTRDLAIALRMLMHRPALLAAAILSLALGIGVNVSVFSVVNSALLRPLPYRDSDRLAMVWHTFGKGQSLPAIHPMDYRDYKARSLLFEDFALVGGSETLLQAKSDPELVRAGNVSGNFFTFLGVEPILGRQFRASDDVPGAAGVALLNYDLWQRQFGGDPQAVGRSVSLDGRPFEVIGVLPRDFELYVPAESFFVKRPQIWRPARIDYATLPPRNFTAWSGIGRMKPGVTLAQAQQEMMTMGAALRRENPVFEAGDLRVSIVPLQRDIVKNVQGGLWALMGAVGFVLLIACANVARLLLARGFSRENEFRMRAALGASGFQLARSVMAEGAVISIGGAFVGVFIAQISLQIIRSVEAAAIPRLETVSLDWRVLSFAVGAALLATLVSAVVPGLRAARAVTSPGTGSDSRTVIGSAQKKALQDRLVIAQVALAVVVVVGTGFMIRSFRAMVEVPLGFEPKGVLTVRLGVPRSRYPDSASTRVLFGQVEETMRRLPGVTSVSATTILPLAGSGPLQTFAYDEQTARNWESATADNRAVSTEFFKTMSAKLVAGRAFDQTDIGDGPRRVIVDTVLARRAFPGRTAVGERLQLDAEPGPSQFAEIVGVVEPLSLQGIVGNEFPQIYEPDVFTRPRATFLIRASGDPEDLVPALRRELEVLTRDIAVQDVRTMDEVVDRALSPTRLAATLMSVFGLVAVILAGLGIYSAIAYSVSQRVREIGIRMALGETPWSLRARVLSQGLRLVGVSLAIGTSIAIALVASARVSFYGVRWSDPWAYIGTILLLGLVAMMACWIPASRASRVDPLQALRHD